MPIADQHAFVELLQYRLQTCFLFLLTCGARLQCAADLMLGLMQLRAYGVNGVW